ncbi:hypothetical protein ACFS7Z_02415 [Pontibacter toksunensis]|uniref:Uncharacterized protein n=1 Tax=Pontibacter toksunensis TaxID=1332631 RepID=A0ABW6BQY4_9BACT
MKAKLISALCCLLSLQFAQAQDIVTKRTGEKVEAKVLEISNTEVKYKLYRNQEGPTYVVPKVDVALIQYQDKTSEVFELSDVALAKATASANSEPVITKTPFSSTATAVQIYNQGQAEAITYYDGYKAAGTAVLITSLLSPLVGLVPAIGTSATPPKTHNLDAPSMELLQQPDYASGYRKSARKIKSGKVWKNWGIGLGANIIAILLISNS